jgi:hypothetical protein
MGKRLLMGKVMAAAMVYLVALVACVFLLEVF